MNNNTLDAMPAMMTERGDNVHLFADCRALAQGQRNSVKFGRELSMIEDVTVGDAFAMGRWACRLCFAKAGIDIPVEADRKATRASRKALRAKHAAADARVANTLANKAIRDAKRKPEQERVDVANDAIALRDLLAQRAALLLSIAAVYRLSDSDKVRWDAATQRHIPAGV